MRIRLYVNDVPYLIELCEGAAEIRRETASKCDAVRRCTVYPFDGSGSPELERAAVSLRVEAV